MLLLLIHNISFLTYQFNVHVCVNTRFLTDLFLGRRRTDLVEGIIHPSHGFRKSSPWNLRESCICHSVKKKLNILPNCSSNADVRILSFFGWIVCILPLSSHQTILKDLPNWKKFDSLRPQHFVDMTQHSMIFSRLSCKRRKKKLKKKEKQIKKKVNSIRNLTNQDIMVTYSKWKQQAK